MKLLAFILCCALSYSVIAQTVMTGFVSKHAPCVNQSPNGLSTPCYNERNTGLGFRANSGGWSGYSVGFYRNTFDRTSVYVGKEWQRQIVGPLYVGLFAGGVTNYGRPITPFVLPEVILKFDPVEAALLVQPFGEGRAAALQLRYSF
jgi:hypothetical protein